MGVSALIYNYFENPWVFWLIIPILIGFIYAIPRDFIKIKDETKIKYSKKKLNYFVLISRIFIVLFLLVALASPFSDETKLVQAEPKIKLLVDNSSSFSLFDSSVVNELHSKLEKKIPVEIDYIGYDEQSPLGDAVLSNLVEGNSYLLITDGYTTNGADLADVSLYANTINATINSLNIIPKHYDSSVRIIGPDKTAANVENSFIVRLTQTKEKKVPVTVMVDGNFVYDGITSSDITVNGKFSDGYHEIVARISDGDYYPANNIFYKTVKVVPKPKVFLYSNRPSDLEELFRPIYDVTVSSSLDQDLSKYTAIISNDIGSSKLDANNDKISSFVVDGNGFVVIGGVNSYDAGDYKGSKIEQLLPVYVAKAGRKAGQNSIVILIDISGSTAQLFGSDKKVDVEKALALAILDDISPVSNVGAVAFNDETYTLSNMSLLLEQKGLRNTIARLKDGGATDISVGLARSLGMLENTPGSKNIILISDGLTRNEDRTIQMAQDASAKGIKIYTVGVGHGTDEDIMRNIADISGGIYFKPTTRQRIKLIFGDSEADVANKNEWPLVIINDDHFITEELEITAEIFGFNSVVPKTAAKLLVSTDSGDPVLSVWRYGLGRVASLSTDDGLLYAFQLLDHENSKLVTRTVNWAIGDPERNNDRFIDIGDVYEGEFVDILFKNDQQPVASDLNFVKIDDNLYKASFLAEDTGFNNFLEATYAVNYKKEYEGVGLNPELSKMVSNTGGSLFDKDDIDGIVNIVKQKSKKSILTKKSYSWIFVLLALMLYLTEVCLRRYLKNYYK